MYPDYSIKRQDLYIEGDVNLREVFTDIVNGNEIERPRGRWIVLQRLKRDSNGQPIESPYSYKISGEGRHDNRGPATTRTGYLCDEELHRVIFRSAQRMIVDEMTAPEGMVGLIRDVVYFTYEPGKERPKEHDIVVFIKIDDNGNIINPVTPIYEVPITKVQEKCSDNGKIEFYVCIVEAQK